MKIEVTELVDPEFDVMIKVPKSSLATLIKTPVAATHYVYTLAAGMIQLLFIFAVISLIMHLFRRRAE